MSYLWKTLKSNAIFNLTFLFYIILIIKSCSRKIKEYDSQSGPSVISLVAFLMAGYLFLFSKMLFILFDRWSESRKKSRKIFRNCDFIFLFYIETVWFFKIQRWWRWNSTEIGQILNLKIGGDKSSVWYVDGGQTYNKIINFDGHFLHRYQWSFNYGHLWIWLLFTIFLLDKVYVYHRAIII